MPCYSILSIGDHINELVSLHALNAKIPVALRAPPPINALTLVEACNTRQAGRCALDFVTSPRAMMVGWVFCHFALWVGPRPRFIAKLDIFEEKGRDGIYLLVRRQVGKVDEIEVQVDRWLFFFYW